MNPDSCRSYDFGQVQTSDETVPQISFPLLENCPTVHVLQLPSSGSNVIHHNIRNFKSHNLHSSRWNTQQSVTFYQPAILEYPGSVQ